MYKVDLNSDLGESFGAYTIGMDEAVIAHISSANVACGYHAGDPLVMDKTVAAAKAAGVAVGAHPGYPDLMGFGRRNMVCSPKEVKAYIQYQLGALMAFTAAHGMKLQHCKPHGSLYNMAAKDMDLSMAIAEAIYSVDKDIILMGLAGSKMLEAGKQVGLRVASEVFADRAYQAAGAPEAARRGDPRQGRGHCPHHPHGHRGQGHRHHRRGGLHRRPLHLRPRRQPLCGGVREEHPGRPAGPGRGDRPSV